MVVQGVRPDPHVDAGTPWGSAHDSSGSVTVESLPSASMRSSVEVFADGEVDRSDGAWGSGIVTLLAPTGCDGEGVVTAFKSVDVDVGPIVSIPRRLFEASSSRGAWSHGDERPAVTRMAPNSLHRGGQRRTRARFGVDG